MKKITISLLTLFATMASFSQSSLLVDASWLKPKITNPNLIIFHVGRKDLYDKEHIPGAQFLSSDEFTVDENGGVFDLPSDENLKAMLESKGVKQNSEIIIYTGVNWVPVTTRLLFTLDYLGLRKQAHVLDGGLIAWKAAGGAVTNEIPVVEKGSVKINPDKNLLVTKEQVKAALETSTKIIDCRAGVFYQGIEVNQMHGGRKGHIPGAKSIPFTSLYEKTEYGSYEFLSKDKLQEIFDGQGLEKEDSIILYCHIGLQLTIVYTAAQLLGYKNVRVYDGSFHEWGPDESLPVETE
ncbi:MAG: sulfurtransferase [Bacteroidetes bacterium]|nr:sulfurtransferase [Bacteroidota bacterium]